MPNVSLQSCARILLEENVCREFLKKMRSPKIEALKKNEIMKAMVKKCNALTNNKKAYKCSRCGYINGLAFFFSSDAFIIVKMKEKCVVCYANCYNMVYFLLILTFSFGCSLCHFLPNIL
jgi:ribosomal protein L40E